MRKILITLLLALSCLGFASESYLGLYLQGTKLGYSVSSEDEEMVSGEPLKRTSSKTVMNAGLLGAAMSIVIESRSWLNEKGPVRMEMSVESAGRTQKLKAQFREKDILVSIDNSGNVSSKTLELPSDGKVVDDALTALLTSNVPIGTKRTFYVLDPMTASLVKNEVTLKGPAKVTVKGVSYDSTLIEISEQRANTRAYVSAKGDLIKAEGPMGIEMIPVSKEEALSESGSSDRPTDLADVTKIKPNKPIGDASNLGSLKLKITGRELSKLPSDAHQTVRQEGESWIVEIHPVANVPGVAIAAAAKQQPAWVKRAMYVPAGNERFGKLAKKVTAGSKTVGSAANAVAQYVFKTMKPNAGIGVLRDAHEVLDSKEGVCRDYAVLTATLLRSAGVPSRVVSGLVHQDGAFYYHAWVEVWNGSNWAGVDSTRPNGKVTAGHIKLAQGNVEEAFNFTFLDQVKVEVLDARRR
ncbi:MAG TPA: transglutaminase-like domain-containing protein [Fimbriimonadaceae bacterium]|nr:transglutaminase-like domain-containing protein [Fimbriimonadaceae bacterium]